MRDKYYPNFVGDSDFERSLFDTYYRKDYEFDDMTGQLADASVYNHYLTNFVNHLGHESSSVKDPTSTNDDILDMYEREFCQDKLKKKWMKLFNARSFNNNVAGEMLFYILISLFTKRKNVCLPNGKILRLHNHFFWIQDSRTGKDQGFDYLIDVIKAYNNRVLLAQFSNPKLREITYFKMDGMESVEVLLDHWTVNKNVKNPEKRFEFHKGIFSSFDLLISPEASVYFVEKRGDKQTKSELLLHGMTGSPIPKRLVGWEGKHTETVGDFCLAAATRPISNMKKHIANSGLQQRGLNFMREISYEESIVMDDKVFMFDKEFYNIGFDFKKELDSFVDLLVEFSLHVEETDLVMDKNCSELKGVTRKYMKFIEDEVDNDDHRRILLSFVRGFNGMATVLAYNNAYVHFKLRVSKTDYEVAYNILDKEFNQLFDWVQENIEIDQIKDKRDRSVAKYVKKIFSRTPKMKRNVLVKYVKSEYGCCDATAYKKLNRLCSKNGFLKFDEDSKEYKLR